MGKLLFWLAVFFLALLVLRLANLASGRARKGGAAQAPKARDTTTVRCARCGVYLPRADAIESRIGLVCGDPQCLPADAGRNRR